MRIHQKWLAAILLVSLAGCSETATESNPDAAENDATVAEDAGVGTDASVEIDVGADSSLEFDAATGADADPPLDAAADANSGLDLPSCPPGFEYQAGSCIDIDGCAGGGGLIISAELAADNRFELVDKMIQTVKTYGVY